MARLNQIIYETTPASRFATFWCGLYDAGSGRLRYSCAGHNPALLLRADEAVVWLKTAGAGLGLARKMSYQQGEIVLGEGDVLVLYTDGVTEAMNPTKEEFGEARLVQTVRNEPAESVARRVAEACLAFAADAPQHDDLTVVVARRHSQARAATT